MVRALVIATVVAAATMLPAQGSARAAGKWCAYYYFDATNCGFNSYQQCLAAISGIGGVCKPSPWN
jgi:hypothetical protein